MFFIVIVSSCFAATIGQHHRCSEKFPLVTDLEPEDCDITQKLYYTENLFHDCFPGCQLIDYDLGSLTCDPRPCPPGYYCPDNPVILDRKCKIDEDSCHKYYVADPSVKYTQALWKPECLRDGTWAPKQCKGEPTNGRCFCFDPVGNRIFGQEFSYKAQNMTCACSRRRSELETAGERVYVGLHCDSVGNYEPLQCDSGQCWCVEPKTGEITAPMVPERLMSYLPCFDKDDMGEQYLRQCESQVYAQIMVTDEYRAHGTQFTNFPALRCRFDGSYGPYKYESSVASCVWGDNSNLGSYMTTENILTVNCNCAYDKEVFSREGLDHTLSCAGNGNYLAIQENSEFFFCVDSDGFRKSPLYTTKPTDATCSGLK